MLYDNFIQFRSRLVGMADEVDSKSIASDGVRVRPPPPVPEENADFVQKSAFSLFVQQRKNRCGTVPQRFPVLKGKVAFGGSFGWG